MKDQPSVRQFTTTMQRSCFLEPGKARGQTSVFYILAFNYVFLGKWEMVWMGFPGWNSCIGGPSGHGALVTFLTTRANAALPL